LLVKDKPGVVAAISDRLAHEQISIESFLQMPVSDGPAVPIVLTTQTCVRAKMEAAVRAIEALDVIAEAPFVMPVEQADQRWSRS
jgi:homoserine dehydrogenase